MAEKYTLQNPIAVTDFSIVSVMLHVRDARIIIEIADTTGKIISAVYTGTKATTMLVALNKADLTNNSLQKRILTQLAADGFIPAGTVTGTPD